MCELKVHVVTPQKDEQVAEEIVYAQVAANRLLLKDALGATHQIPDALISTVDIGKESLYVKQASIVGPFLRFLEAYQTAEATQTYSEVEESWNDLKAKGDEAVRVLWRKHRRSS